MRGLGSNRKLRVAICGMLSGRKRRIAREACRADCPSWKPCGVVPAGTGEGISARIHAANSQGDKAEEGRRSARRHNANSLGVRVESCVSLVAGIVVGVSRARGVESSIIICKARNVKNADCQWVHHPTCHPRTLPGRAASGGALATETKRATGQSSYGLSWKTGGAFFWVVHHLSQFSPQTHHNIRFCHPQISGTCLFRLLARSRSLQASPKGL